MYKTEIRWDFEQALLVMKITATARLSNVDIIDNNTKLHLILKMVNVIQGAERFEGIPLSMIPSIQKSQNSVVVSSSIIFNSNSNLEAFYNECSKILYKE